MARYYFDSCIWRDHYENRFGPKGRPLGKYATALFMKIMKDGNTLLFSKFILNELRLSYTMEEINVMMNLLYVAQVLKKIEIQSEDRIEAEKIAKDRSLPLTDVLHAILARNNNAIMISQDKHFQRLKDIVEVKRPEEIL
ncbi:MAG: PIN domain-containing protein [archaeon]